MAISQIGFGLKPINKTGSNYNAAQVTEYISIGRVYYPAAFQSPISVNNGYGTRGVLANYFNSRTIDGSFVGAQYVGSNGKPVFTDHYTTADLNHIALPANAGLKDSFSQFVTDDPYQLYLIKIRGALTLSLINGNYDTSQAFESDGFSPDKKRSQIVLVSGSQQVRNSALPLQFVSLGPSPDDVQTSKDLGRTDIDIDDGILDSGSNIIVRLNKAKYLQQSDAINSL